MLSPRQVSARFGQEGKGGPARARTVRCGCFLVGLTAHRIHLPPRRSPRQPERSSQRPQPGRPATPTPRRGEPGPSPRSCPGLGLRSPGPRAGAPSRSGRGKRPGTRAPSPAPGAQGNASSQLPGSCAARPNRKAPSAGHGLHRAAGLSRPRRARRGAARRGAGRGRPRRPGAPLTVCSCSSARARGSSSSSHSAAAAVTPGAPGSGLILRAPAGPAPAHRLLRRRRSRFASTGRGQTHGARTRPLAPRRRRRHRPLRRLPRPPAPPRPLPLTQPRHPATPARAGSAVRRGPQPPPAAPPGPREPRPPRGPGDRPEPRGRSRLGPRPGARGGAPWAGSPAFLPSRLPAPRSRAVRWGPPAAYRARAGAIGANHPLQALPLCVAREVVKSS